MRKRIERLREESETFKRKTKLRNAVVFKGILLCVVLFYGVTFLAGAVSPDSEDTLDSSDNQNSSDEIDNSKYNDIFVSSGYVPPWNMILVNDDNPIPDDFEVELEYVGDALVDKRIILSLSSMIEDAENDGVELRVISSYRDKNEQAALFNNKLNSYLDEGLSLEESTEKTSLYLQEAGFSEHQTGLAIDFAGNQVNAVLNDNFAETKEYEWLMENSVKYGFVERYPKGKEEITGIQWESWHFRYVGEEAAFEMSSEVLCLEEYLVKLQ